MKALLNKLGILLAAVLLAALLASCAAPVYNDYQELNNGVNLQHNDVTYSFYCALPKDELRGKQIGIIGGNRDHKVFEMAGYPPDDWVIEYLDVFMSIYTVYKADTVSEIPEELK